MATDEICCPLRTKPQGRQIDETTGGNAGCRAALVGAVSANAAKMMGLYPRKGALAVGSDADIVLLDPRQRDIVRTAELNLVGGPRPRRLPSLGMLRGKIVIENGAFSGDLKDGQLLPRKVPEEMRLRPAF